MNHTNLKDYRSYLAAELASRCLRNVRYSQAAFARDLGISPSLLSEVLTGRHELSRQKAERIATQLGFNSKITRIFCDSAEAHSSRSPRRRVEAQRRLKRLASVETPLSLRDEQLSAMGDWFYIAIIETLKLTEAGQEESEIAKRLRLQSAVVREALAKLKRLDLVASVDKKWIAKDKRFIVEGGLPSATLKRLHGQFMMKAQQSIYDQQVGQRYLTTAVVPVPRHKIKEISAKLEQMRKDLCDEIHGLPGKDSIYCLALQFFELTEEIPHAKS